MSAIDGQKLLRTAIKERTFSPAYLLFGDEDFRKHDAVTKLLDAAVDRATRDFNLEIRRGGEIDAETLGSLLSTPPMMAERRVVVIRDVGALKKDARAALDRYLDHPASDLVLVLVVPAGGTRSTRRSSTVPSPSSSSHSTGNGSPSGLSNKPNSSAPQSPPQPSCSFRTALAPSSRS